MSGRDVYAEIERMRESGNAADAVVVAIFDDVTDRRGWRQEFDGFDTDIQCEIVEAWRAKVGAIMEGGL